MGAFINNSVTNAGDLLIAKALSGTTITFTKIVMGDGILDPQTDIKSVEAVISPKATVDIAKKTTTGSNTAIVGGVFLNNETNEGFYWRELALYAEDPDLGEVLYSYGNAGDLAEWIPPSGSQTVVEKSIDILTSVGDAANVAVYINPSSFATIEQYEAYLEVALQALELATSASDIAGEALRVANEANNRTLSMKKTLDEIAGKVQAVWDALFTEITTNPFLISFGDLDGVTVTAGIWDKPLSALRC